MHRELEVLNATLRALIQDLDIQEAQRAAGEREAEVRATIAAQERLNATLVRWLDAQPDDGRAAALRAEMLRQLDEAIREGKSATGWMPPF